MTQTRTHSHASGSGGGHDPGRANRDGRTGGMTVRMTAGGYFLAALAALVSGLSLAGAAPGRVTAAYLAAGVAVAILLVGSVVLHEAGHLLVVTPADLARAAQLGALRQRSESRDGSADVPSWLWER